MTTKEINKLLISKNMFHVSYKAMCSEEKKKPINEIRIENEDHRALDFFADQIEFDNWSPILRALRYDDSLHFIAIRMYHARKVVLHDVDSRAKAQSLKCEPVLLTWYMLMHTIDALSYCIRKTQVLTCLTLDGIPVKPQYLTILVTAMSENRSIRELSFRKCLLGDDGCFLLCEKVKNLSNLTIIDFTSCNITERGVPSLCALLKHQCLLRLTKKWKTEKLPPAAGLRRITLNENRILDVGFNCFIDSIKNDKWLRALDLQSCGLTDKSAVCILDALLRNKHIEVVDIRCNDQINKYLVKSISDILNRPSLDTNKRYEWLKQIRSCRPKNISHRSGFSTATSQLDPEDIYDETPQATNRYVLEEIERNKYLWEQKLQTQRTTSRSSSSQVLFDELEIPSLINKGYLKYMETHAEEMKKESVSSQKRSMQDLGISDKEGELHIPALDFVALDLSTDRPDNFNVSDARSQITLGELVETIRSTFDFASAMDKTVAYEYQNVINQKNVKPENYGKRFSKQPELSDMCKRIRSYISILNKTRTIPKRPESVISKQSTVSNGRSPSSIFMELMGIDLEKFSNLSKNIDLDSSSDDDSSRDNSHVNTDSSTESVPDILIGLLKKNQQT